MLDGAQVHVEVHGLGQLDQVVAAAGAGRHGIDGGQVESSRDGRLDPGGVLAGVQEQGGGVDSGPGRFAAVPTEWGHASQFHRADFLGQLLGGVQNVCRNHQTGADHEHVRRFRNGAAQQRCRVPGRQSPGSAQSFIAHLDQSAAGLGEPGWCALGIVQQQGVRGSAQLGSDLLGRGAQARGRQVVSVGEEPDLRGDVEMRQQVPGGFGEPLVRGKVLIAERGVQPRDAGVEGGAQNVSVGTSPV